MDSNHAQDAQNNPNKTTKMNTSTNQTQQIGIRSTLAMLLIALMVSATGVAQAKEKDTIEIVLPDATYLGKTYPEWAAEFWQWMLGLPLEGHPVVDDGLFDFSANQSGKVWFWASPEGTITREVTLPEGKAFLLSLRDVDTSSLEEPPFFGATEEQQRSNSVWFADHISDVFCTVDGVPIDLTPFRFLTAQFEFTAPTPFIFGATGGTGTAVGDGYFLMFPNLPKGRHTIHYGGTFHFEPGELADEELNFTKDTTIEMTVGK